MTKQFVRQHFQNNLDDKTFKCSPATQLPAFMVGRIKDSVYGIEDLIVALNAASFGWSTDFTIHPHWDFILLRNIDQTNPTVDIYAVPRTNERSAGSFYLGGFYEIPERELNKVIETWHRTQSVIATFIEGWLAGRAKAKNP